MRDSIIIEGQEQTLVDPALPDAGLPPVIGVRSFQVFRASRAVPEITDGRGWTYHHHVDMACWRGRLYVGWNSCQRDEDVWPSRELLSTSLDGATWSDPVELFPQGVSTPLRMYFYHAPNGRMLAIAGLRVNQADTDEDTKGGLVVREIRADHSLGEVFTLRRVGAPVGVPPMFDQSNDETFVQACQHLLANRPFLEQQDRGRLLVPDQRMKWHDAGAWPGGKVPGDSDKWVAGKAYSFFRRPDGALVGISKMGWTTLSYDEGKTWSQPIVPPTLVTGKAKVWGQRTRDGRYALVYNPSTRNRFPLAIVTGDDGIHFRNMRIVQGELPVQRYEGLHRSIGPQYVRGISMWSDDGSRADDQVIWLVYSMNKEDIWVSRVPLPVRGEAKAGDQPAWNIYCPKWAAVTVQDDEVRLEDRDPYDYAGVARVVPPCRNVTVSFAVLAEQAAGQLEVELEPGIRKEIPIERPNEWCAHRVSASSLHRITLRTGPYRGIGGVSPVRVETDRPHPPVAFRIRELRIT